MIGAIERNWKALALIAAILVAGAAGARWADALQSEVAANTEERLIREFERLSNARKFRTLSIVEWRRWCNAGYRLKVFTPQRPCPPRKK